MAERSGVRQRIESFVLASPQKRNLAICLLLAVATLALYSPAIRHPFIFNYDDDVYVLNNAHVKAGLHWQTIRWAVTSTENSNWHPMTWLSHAMDCQLYGLNPPGHHFTNVLFHVMNVVLIFLLLVYATSAPGRSFLVAALFAIHPFNVESVAWIAERKNVLSTFFFLLTIGAYGWYALKPDVKRYLAVAALFVLGLASKAMVVTLPCVLLLLDFWPLRRIQGLSTDENALPQMRFSWLVLEKLPLLALSAATSAVTMFAQRSGGAMRLALPLSVRLGNAIYAYAIYVWKAIWPAWLGLFYPHPGAILAIWRLALAALFLLLVSVFVWWQRTARPYLVTGWLWFLGTLIPVIGLVQVGEQAIADRYAYIPLIGIFVITVWGAADLADRLQLSFRSRVKIAAVVIAIFALFTIDQLRYWRSAVDVWAHTVKVTNDNFLGEQNLGAALLAAERYQEALPHFTKAVQLRPSDPASHLNLGGDLAVIDRPREAIAQYEAAIPLTSDPAMRVEAYEILGRLYSQLGQYSKARISYEQALKIDPEQAKASSGLAKVELSDAIRQVAEGPSAEKYFRLGQVFQHNGRTVEAQAAYKQALKLNPKLGEAREALDAMSQQNK
ncbi:MAG TPA: tetratricopeptide repeat protein [Terriglobales bacterium]|nr:tetratricopeptide repeat protein [Terriglobales bacterium]